MRELFAGAPIQLSSYRRLFPQEAEFMIETMIESWIATDVVAYMGISMPEAAKDILISQIKKVFWHWRPGAFALFTHELATGKLEKVYGKMNPIVLMERMAAFDQQVIAYAGAMAEADHANRTGDQKQAFNVRKPTPAHLDNLQALVDAWSDVEPGSASGPSLVRAIDNNIKNSRKR